jgi:gamma-glutamylcyclotransferase (GGCT)/AIG2-like uncharacterized protein YtfP
MGGCGENYETYEPDGRADYETSRAEDRHLREWTFAHNDENDTERLSLPYAVYGTLRPNCGNDRLWDGIANLGSVGVVEGYKMVTGMSMSFPYALPAPHSRIVVELLYPVEGYSRVLRDRFDTLEGYPNFYGRDVVKVHTVWGDCEAWLYVPRSSVCLGDIVDVPSGDWTEHRALFRRVL